MSSDLLERAFPFGDDEPDVLGGIPDATFGLATEYFSSLSESERELVQWYLEQSIPPAPARLEYYILGLAKGYHLADPERKSTLGIEAAVEELQRLGRYIDVFAKAENFFPQIVPFSRTEVDEDGDTYESQLLCWGCFATSNSKPFSLDLIQFVVQEQIGEQLEMISRFIQYPSIEPEVLSVVETIISQEKAQRISS